MSFVQIIEYETDRPDEMRALGESQMAGSPGTESRVLVCRDRDKPNHFFTIVEFPSYEAAMENSARPEVDAFAQQMMALSTSGPRFYNLDVETTSP